MASKAWCGTKVWRLGNKVLAITAQGATIDTYERFKSDLIPWIMKESVERRGYYIEPEEAHMEE